MKWRSVPKNTPRVEGFYYCKLRGSKWPRIFYVGIGVGPYIDWWHTYLISSTPLEIRKQKVPWDVFRNHITRIAGPLKDTNND
jgi:hypothetical protein